MFRLVARSALMHLLAAVTAAACGLALIGWGRRSHGSPSGSHLPPGYVVNRTGPVTVYAPTGTDAAVGQQQLAYSRTEFQRIFGATPRPIVVLLANQPSQLARIDASALRQPGAGYLPFLTTSSVTSLAGASIGEAAPLAHEACHVYVSALADGQVGQRTAAGGRYGAPALPDWFDEAAATLCESPAGRAARRSQLREHINNRIPLRRLFQIQHPLNAAYAADAVRSGKTAQAYVRVIKLPNDGSATGQANVAMFYSEAQSVGEFLAERGGPGALGTLVPPLAKGASMDEALRQARLSAPGLPGSVDELERDWITWIGRGDHPRP